MNEEPTEDVPLAELVREEQWYPRRRLSPDRVADYAAYYREAGPEALPPIQVGLIPEVDGFWLVDGWHRASAAEEVGLDRLPAIVHHYADRWDALADAIRIANNGSLSLTPGEKSRLVDMFLRHFPTGTDRELAHRLGVSHVYVWKRRRKLHRKPASPDPLLQQVRALWQSWTKLCADRADDSHADEEDPSPAAEALATAAIRAHGQEAGLRLQWLEDTAHAAWQLVAAEDPPPRKAMGQHRPNR